MSISMKEFTQNEDTEGIAIMRVSEISIFRHMLGMINVDDFDTFKD